MRFGSVLLFSLLLCNLGYSQTGTATSLQIVQTQARSALTASNQPTSITLDGAFTSTAGSLQQSGNAHLTVGSDGSFLISLSRSVGAISESRTVTDGIPACTWMDKNSVVHSSSFPNCTPPAWFFPGLTLLTTVSNTSIPAWVPSSYSSDSLGNHLRFQYMLPGTNGSQDNSGLLSPFDLVLAPDTNLPRYALFTAHPDQGAVNASIAVRIEYSNYRSVSGVMIPFHIQRFMNGSLVLDLTISTASVQ